MSETPVAHCATRRMASALRTTRRRPAPDVLILDQHLDYSGVILYGTDVAQRLRTAGYGGFICVRSANATEHDEALYRRCGAAQGLPACAT